MPEVGLDGQKKLKAAKVLIVGAGGLGSPAALYLAAAGVGIIGIVDCERVEASNLQRQILYSPKDAGRPKASAAKERLLSGNPHVEVITHGMRLNSENALDVLGGYDVIVDASDNFPTRYLVNDACVLLRKPDVFGSVFRFDGQVSVFYALSGPCYRCMCPAPPPSNLVQSCSESGVLGVLPGIVGTIQTAEVIKLILGIGQALIGKVLLFEALNMQFREIRVRKNPACPLCGQNPVIKRLIDYEAFCESPMREGESPAGVEITVEELKRRLDNGEEIFILDVRQPFEYDIVNIGGYLIPLGDLTKRLHELDRSREIVIHCHHTSRSVRAAGVLRQAGFQNVKILVGGIDEWAARVDPALARY
jgi:adenylyltransferase/sulfurtransferase